MTPTPPRSRVEAPRWYSVTRDGAATLCVDEDDARQVASESDVAWPRMGPHRAVQLVDASAIAELEADCAALRKDAERYRWLRDVSVPPHNFYLSVPVEFDGVRYAPDEVDAAIDAALAAQPEKG